MPLFVFELPLAGGLLLVLPVGGGVLVPGTGLVDEVITGRNEVVVLVVMGPAFNVSKTDIMWRAGIRYD